jgi:hypothetical protein
MSKIFQTGSRCKTGIYDLAGFTIGRLQIACVLRSSAWAGPKFFSEIIGPYAVLPETVSMLDADCQNRMTTLAVCNFSPNFRLYAENSKACAGMTASDHADTSNITVVYLTTHVNFKAICSKTH